MQAGGYNLFSDQSFRVGGIRLHYYRMQDGLRDQLGSERLECGGAGECPESRCDLESLSTSTKGVTRGCDTPRRIFIKTVR